MSSRTGSKGRHDAELSMFGKGDTKAHGAGGGGGPGEGLSRRAKRRANEQQKQHKVNATRMPLDRDDAVTATTSKRYQSSRYQSAAHKRDRNRKSSEGAEDEFDAPSSCELQLANLPEDMRISRLLRRLANEQSVRGCLDLCARLEVVILDPPNASYVRKSFDILANTIVSILEDAPRDCRDRVAQLFGMMLYIVGCSSPDRTAFRLWTTKWLWQIKRLHRSMLIALRHALILDQHAELHLEPIVVGLLGKLQELLEVTDGADVFVLVTDIMIGLSDAYPRCFETHFGDVVDIVVGWQLETTQRTRLKVHCARVLLAFRPYWVVQHDVTLNLLNQFIEDIQGCWDDIEEDDHQQWHTAHRLSAALLTAFNSVFKCLHTETTAPIAVRRTPLGGGFDLMPDDRELFESGAARIMPIISTLIDEPPSDLTLAAICEFLMMCLTLPGQCSAHAEVQRLIQDLIGRAGRYSDSQLCSLLLLLLRYVETDASEQQPHTIALLPLIMTAGATEFYTLRYRRSKSVQRALLLLYHRVLTLKNIAILHAAYGFVLDDLEDAMDNLRRHARAHAISSSPNLQTQYRISFNLLVLSPLAMARNSIFITWTLQDRSVLHVLLERLAADGKLWAHYSQLYHTILLLAYHHCTANNNFVSSSNLLQAKSYGGTVDRFLRLDLADRGEKEQKDVAGTSGESASTSTPLPVPNSSPTADHFGLVLRFLGIVLSEWTDKVAVDGEGVDSEDRSDQGRPARLQLLLDWCLAIVTQTERYHDVLQECPGFNRLLTLVCTVSVDCGSASERIGLRCADCLDAVCQYVSLHPAVYQAIAEACCVHLCSVYGSLRGRYTVIFSRLPLRYSLRQVNAFTGVNRGRREEIRQLKNVLYQSTSTELRHRQSAVLRMADLRALLNQMAFSRDNTAYIGEYLHELLTRSYNQPSAYGEMALRDLRCLVPWAQWEAAQLCVNHKLRTPFGKPQSTFLRIESIVKQCARILALSDQFPVRDIRTSIANQRHARILLGFLEALEKSIYNAAEGTAYALPAPEKPARTFFRVNAPTCAEWFTRIRTAVDLVALHCMEPEMVIRYSEAVLRELVAAGKTSDLIFEHMLMSLVWALLRNWESDALYGVYVWSRQLTGRKYSWIRMAAEEAAGHRETAADGFRAILADSAGAGMDRHIRDFIVDQTIVSLLFTGAYTELYQFLLAEESGGTPRATIPLITITAEQVHSIIRYEETQDVSVIDISQWELVDLGNDIPNNFSCHRMICAVENSLSGIIMQEQIEERERMIEVSTELIQCYLQECLLTKCREYLFQLTITNHILYKIAQRTRTAAAAATSTKLSSACHPSETPLKYDDGIGTLSVEKFYGTMTLMRLLAWSECLLGYYNASGTAHGGTGYEGEQQNIDLRLDMVSIGRKEKNYALCRRELQKYYHKSNLAQRLRTLCSKPTLEQVAEALMSSASHGIEPNALWGDQNLSRAVYEHCKWLYCQPGKRIEAIDFAACASSAIDGVATQPSPCSDPRPTERAARFLLTLGDWLSGTTGPESVDLLLASLKLASVQQLGARLPPIDAKPLAPDHAAELGASDLLVGSLLQGAASRCPTFAKAWFQLGSWLYRWGKRVIELSSGTSSARISVEQVAAILTGPHVTTPECERIVAILNEYEPGRTSDDDGGDDGELDLDNSTTIGSIGLLEALQDAMPTLKGRVPPEQLHAIIDVWRSNHRAVYGYYEAAAAAYFRFLQLSTVSARSSGADDDAFDSERARSVTVTLRLLRLIVKHALGLKEVLEEGLATTPSEPWRVITPQLFSRLAHHEPYVRRRVSELLCRVAKDAPHLIIFPAVVGSVQEEQTELANVVNVLLDASGEFEGENGAVAAAAAAGIAPATAAASPASGLAFCFNALLDILSREVPDTVKQVQTLVHELRRISLLWEELWLVSLQQIYAEYAKRVSAFEGEYARQYTAGLLTEPRRVLLAEKHRLLLRPLIFVLEQLYTITARPAETNHERHFQERYHRYIRNMIETLEAPADFSRPIEGWERFRALYTQLQARSQKRFAFFLRLADVSPNLQQLAHTAISMPGIDTTTMTTGAGGIGGGGGHCQSILIRSVDPGIQILPTKTRPKKLLFHGNDGRRYGYLSKGLEDLHLDERIMQFLSIANLMMTRSIDCNGNVTHYRAEHYSVIPLGPRSGLITWVDSTVPILSLYKKWQQREALQKKEGKQGGAAVAGAGGSVLRPSELFYQKLNPLLHSHGKKSTDNRREWPVAVLKQVLSELQQETPRDLLAKELWCHSATASSWRQVVRTYSLSLAVMSVIGYIIGLGDRHLDNVLVKLATGEVVHIDYNVCFEKGKTLRVPEKVPFRMTPNLEEALGVTGIEGTFRLACEHVLKSLKKGRETLLTLLEAFVYDPLVDWAISEEVGGGVPMTATEITVSTMTAATGPATASLTTAPATSRAASKYISQAKKQLDREVTRDTLAVRFAECRADWQQNRNELLQHLVGLRKHLAEQVEQQRELRDAERLRTSLSQQLQLIDEAEYLDTAFASHPLASLAHRLDVRTKLHEECGAMYDQLRQQVGRLRAHIEQHADFRRTFHADRLAGLRQDACPEGWRLAEHTPQLVAFLAGGSDNGKPPGEDTSYVQYCCARTELSELQRRAAPVTERLVQLLVQYGELAGLLEHESQEQDGEHPLARYADWYARVGQPGQAPAAALATVQQVLQERQETRARTEMQRVQLQAKRKAHLDTVIQSLRDLAISPTPPNTSEAETACIRNGGSLHDDPYSILLYFAAARRIVELNRSLLAAERAVLLEGRVEVSDENSRAERIWTLARHIREHCEWLVHQQTTTTAATARPFEELLQATADYEALQRLHERIQLLAVADVSPPSDTTHPWDAGFEPLLERAVEVALESETVTALLNRWIGTPARQCLEVARLLEAASGRVKESSDSCRSNPLPPADRICGSGIDHIHEAAQLRAWRSPPSTTEESTSSSTTAQDLETKAAQLQTLLVQRAANEDDDGLWAALLLPMQRFIARDLRTRLAGRVPLAAATLVYRSALELHRGAEGREETLGGGERITLVQVCRDSCLAALGNGRYSEQLDQLEQVARRYNELVLAAIGEAEVGHVTQLAEETAQHLREPLLQQLRDGVVSIGTLRPLLQAAQEQLVACSEVLRNRLAWATAAHPPLCSPDLLGAFEQGTAQSVEGVGTCLRACDLAVRYASAVLQFEETRYDADDGALARQFEALTERWQKLLTHHGLRATFVSATEEALVELLDPEGSIDHTWISNVRALIDDMTDQVLTKIVSLEQASRGHRETLLAGARKLNGLIVAHNAIAGDIRVLLRTQLRIGGSTALRDYLQRYRRFLELLQEVRDGLTPQSARPKPQDNPPSDSTEHHQQEQTTNEGTMAKVNELLALLQDVFNQLFTFEHPDDTLEAPADDGTSDPGRHRATDSPTGAAHEAQLHDSKDQKQKEQKRNAYAVSVWRRIRLKLEGRDPEPCRRYGVPEQVSWMIQEAMDPNNLAVLYEGWTPWV